MNTVALMNSSTESKPKPPLIKHSMACMQKHVCRLKMLVDYDPGLLHQQILHHCIRSHRCKQIIFKPSTYGISGCKDGA